ncbi:MAG: hypothetical protein KatS3mg052_1753 [Candidatus Roseilinea sp.]|nr:MAG: hypothetical protein KatS3mg052_1753 [Candidatus Roseilinea sp.]
MPFTVSDFHDLVELLEQQPSWRAEMRRLLLTDDILRLPKTVEDLAATVDQFARNTEERFCQVEKILADLAAAQQRTEQHFEELAAAQQRTEQRFEELAAAQQRTEQRLEELAAAQQRTEQRLEELAAAQQRTEQRLEELAAAQQRTEQRLEELAAAQQRTEQRLEELAAAQQRTEQRLEELAAAQQRTEQRLEELAAAQQRTSEQVARLQNIIGATVEEEAAAVLRVVLEEKGYHILAEALYLRLNGDVDVAQQVEDAQGRRLWAVLEAKTRLGWQAVEAWANRIRSEGFRAALRRVGVEGPFLVYVYGMRADLSARKAVEKFGVGLLSSQGEIVPPKEELSA